MNSPTQSSESAAAPAPCTSLVRLPKELPEQFHYDAAGDRMLEVWYFLTSYLGVFWQLGAMASAKRLRKYRTC